MLDQNLEKYICLILYVHPSCRPIYYFFPPPPPLSLSFFSKSTFRTHKQTNGSVSSLSLSLSLSLVVDDDDRRRPTTTLMATNVHRPFRSVCSCCCRRRRRCEIDRKQREREREREYIDGRTMDHVMMKEILNKASAHIEKENDHDRSLQEIVYGFYYAVDWSQYWLRGLFVFYAILLILIFLSRDILSVQVILFLGICSAVFLTEKLNTVLHEHWQEFADQDYFDESGVFLCTIYSAPLLIIGFIQVVVLLIDVSRLLIRAKRAEIRHNNSKKRIAQAKKTT